MMADPALPMKSAATQLQKLIVDPFKCIPTPCPSLILIIEGLNECEDEFEDALPVLISKAMLDPTVKFGSSFPGSWIINMEACTAAILFWLGSF